MQYMTHTLTFSLHKYLQYGVNITYSILLLLLWNQIHTVIISTVMSYLWIHVI